ncbi:MAG: TIGR02646 family protein [Clostridiales bacterium]|nr:TIGR02646 family protein [Candidatus Blautia equi]
MIKIVKGPEPEVLTRKRKNAEKKHATPNDAYASLSSSDKKTIRESLVHDQGKLCAYCMCRIPRSGLPQGVTPIIIEHRIPRNPKNGLDVGQGLDYNNLFAVCNGNTGKKGTRTKMDLTCDAYKSNLFLKKVNPVDEETLSTISYTTSGKILAKDEDVQYDLTEVLNLNSKRAPLISERKAVIMQVMQQLNQVRGKGEAEFIKAALAKYEKETDPKTPYVGVITWYLNSFLKSVENRS